MVRMAPTTTARRVHEPSGRVSRARRDPGKRASPWLCLLACVATAAPLDAARAAMNFCAAPALQTSERTNAAPAVATLMKRVAAQLGDAPKPLAQVHTEGTLPHEGIYDESVEARKDLDLMRDAALVWRATGDGRYLRLVDRFLLAWATTYRPSFNPIDETHFDAMILAYDLTASALPVKTRNATAAFIATLANGYVERIDAEPRPLTGNYRNNWESHRVKLVAMAAFALDDRKLINAAQRLFVEQIGNNIVADGATFDFAEHDALHYVTYDLEPLVIAALAARRHNRNWLVERGGNGASLARALDWLVPYALGQKTHEEFAGSSVQFDTKRREAGIEGFSGQWNPQHSAELFHLAARLSGRYAPVALHLSPAPPPWLAVCLPLAAR
jgi:Alginate lyase